MDVDIRVNPDPVMTIQRLDEYADELQGKALSSGITAAAKVYKDEMKKTTPRGRGGALLKSIGHAKMSRTAKLRLGIPQHTQAALVGPIRKVVDPTYYRDPGKKIAQGFKAYWLEYGTKGHQIPKKDKIGKKILHLGKSGGGKDLFYRSVDVEGITPTRFISRAYNAAKGREEELFYKGVEKRLNKFDYDVRS